MYSLYSNQDSSQNSKLGVENSHHYLTGGNLQTSIQVQQDKKDTGDPLLWRKSDAFFFSPSTFS